MTVSNAKGRLPAKPGAELKAIRARRGWTLADVSRRTGLTVSTLSKVENDRIALNFEKLVRLSEGLEIDVAELFGSTAEEQHGRIEGATRRSVTRAGEGRSIEVEGGNYLYLATELLHKRMIPIMGEVFQRDIAEYKELLRHDGEEFVYVVEGTLELHTALYTPVRLETGDSVYFDSAMGHAYVTVGEGTCRILSVNATSEARTGLAIERLGQHSTGDAAAQKPRVKRRSAG